LLRADVVAATCKSSVGVVIMNPPVSAGLPGQD
jgi:hypothetical protein